MAAAAAAAAAATTATARAFHITRLWLKPLHSSLRPHLPSATKRRSQAAVSCVISGVDGGGVSDDFISTRKSGFDREFSVIADMLKRIEPLDTTVISKGVSDFAKDSMKQTISTMLGLLPSDQFAVTVRVSKGPLNRLLVSSVITGYTLWNAEYRISLMRNFDLSPDYSKKSNSSGVCEVLKMEEDGEFESGFVDEVEKCCEDMGGMRVDDSVDDLSSEEMDYIQRLECEIANAEQELHAQKKENLQMEFTRSSNNDLLEYLRSLDSDMVTELSRPSSSEVEEVIQQLVQNIMQRFFKEENSSDKMMDSAASDQDHQNGSDDLCDTVGTSRDYLAKLLFWCMLLGHHLRGLENRVHLSCAVGLL